MLFWIIIKVSLGSLWAAKLRSFLAILGIIMGVGAVISMLSIVEGARRQMDGMIGSLGTNVLYIWPDARGTRGRASAPTLSLNDARAILAEADVVSRVSPQLQTSVVAKYGSKNAQLMVEGVAPSYAAIRGLTVEKGRNFTDSEVNQAARVMVLGPRAAEKLFGQKDPVGKEIKVNQLVFRVIGVFKAKGAEGFMNDDDHIVAPFTTVQRQITGRRSSLGSICVEASSTEQLKLAEDQIRQVLRRRHGLKPDQKDDFNVFNQLQLLEVQQRAVGIFGIVLGGIGGICLLTGGIGIMNIMLVIVTERTGEIGLRKALGAKNRAILTQFLIESVLISAIGGVLGIAGGAGLGMLISSITPLKTAVSAQSIMLALTCATCVGIFFGFYPAMRAARLDPIQALHFE